MNNIISAEHKFASRTYDGLMEECLNELNSLPISITSAKCSLEKMAHTMIGNCQTTLSLIENDFKNIKFKLFEFGNQFQALTTVKEISNLIDKKTHQLKMVKQVGTDTEFNKKRMLATILLYISKVATYIESENHSNLVYM